MNLYKKVCKILSKSAIYNIRRCFFNVYLKTVNKKVEVTIVSVADEYRKIYDACVSQELKKEIAIYEQEKGINRYQPLSHNCNQKCSTL